MAIHLSRTRTRSTETRHPYTSRKYIISLCDNTIEKRVFGYLVVNLYVVLHVYLDEQALHERLPPQTQRLPTRISL